MKCELWNDLKCELCSRANVRLHGHHLSYEPEIVVLLCKPCHLTVHRMAMWDSGTITKVLEWITTYSSQWINGTEKFNKSNYHKQYQHDYNKKYRDIQKHYAQNKIYRQSPEVKAKRNAYQLAYYHKYKDIKPFWNKKKINLLEA